MKHREGSFTANADQSREESEDRATGQITTRVVAARFIVASKWRMKPKGVCMVQGQVVLSGLVPSMANTSTLTRLRKTLGILILLLWVYMPTSNLESNRSTESLLFSQCCLKKVFGMLCIELIGGIGLEKNLNMQNKKAIVYSSFLNLIYGHRHAEFNV